MPRNLGTRSRDKVDTWSGNQWNLRRNRTLTSLIFRHQVSNERVCPGVLGKLVSKTSQIQNKVSPSNGYMWYLLWRWDLKLGSVLLPPSRVMNRERGIGNGNFQMRMATLPFPGTAWICSIENVRWVIGKECNGFTDGKEVICSAWGAWKVLTIFQF